MKIEVRLAIFVLCVSCLSTWLYAAEPVQVTEAEDAYIGHPAARDTRGHDSGKASVHLSAAAAGKPDGYVEIVSELPYDVYHVFVRVWSGSFEAQHYGDGTYTLKVGDMEVPIHKVNGTVEMYGDADNWVWLRTNNAVPIGKGVKIRISSTWVWAFVDLFATSTDPQYIPEKEEIEKYPVMTALKIQQAPKLDGKLAEAFWEKSQMTDSFSRRDAGGPPSRKTKAMCVWTDEALYVGMRCFEKNMTQVVADITVDDGPVFRDETALSRYARMTA